MLSVTRPRGPIPISWSCGVDPLELDGVVAEALPNAMYRVVLNDKTRSSVTAHSGSQSLLRLRPGDKVVVALSPYDQTRGRVIRKVSA
jgi:translation initiation factor IF-1